MKNSKLRTFSAILLVCTLSSNAYAESAGTGDPAAEGAGANGSGGVPATGSGGKDAVTPESLREQLRSINTQRHKVNVTETTGAIPRLPDEVPTGEDEDLWRLRRESMHFFSGGMHLRFRDGEEGLDQLFATGAPLQFNFNTGLGRIGIDTETVFLSAGDLSNSEFTNRYYGALSLIDPAQRPADISDDDAGVAISVGYEVGGFEVHVGTTPAGFEIVNETARVRFDHSFSSGFNFGLGVSREPVKDSVLSYAGLEDPVTGEKWGGIVKDAGNLSLGYDVGNFGVYIDGTIAVYQGDHVDDNDFFQINTGLYFHPYRGDNLQISSGFNVTYFSFEENLRYFTFGHGGYFSPESFYSASIPFRVAYSEGKLTVKADIGAGMQNFSEDSADFFPADPALQANLEAIENVQPVSFEQDSETQFAARGGAEVIYQLSPALSARGKLEFSNAADYEEVNFLVGVEYRFGRGY